MMAGVFAFRFSSSRALRVHCRKLGNLAVDTRSDQKFRIPLIDLSKFRNANSLSEKRKTADEIVTGFKEVGFVYLEGHGVPLNTVDNVFTKSAEFFRLPLSVKDKLAWEDPRSNRGYVKLGRELAALSESTDAAVIAELRNKPEAPDTNFKESMEIGRDWDQTWRNRWPEENDVPAFKQTMVDFFQTCHETHTIVMRAIALGLDLDETFFEDKINDQCHNLRLLSYPAIKTSLLKEGRRARVGSHSDYGTLTLVFQDNLGGLEVENPHTKQFQPAKPIPGTIIVNTGDLLARWSNDVLRSTLHRVVAPPTENANADGMTPLRQSIGFFCNPSYNARISCLPSCHWSGNKAKYAPITTEEYIVGRLAGTYI